MRRHISIVALACLTAVAAGPASAQDQKQVPKAAAILKAAREALGGDRTLASIATIRARGSHRRTMGDTQMNGETEITIAFADGKYLRSQTDEMFGNSINIETGFVGDEPVQRSNSMGGGHGVVIRMTGPGGPGAPEGDPAALKAAQLRAQRADYARLLLGWMATAPPFIDATFTYAGVAESPDGRADVLDVKGQDGFAAKLFIDQETHRPLMLTYMGAQPVVRVMRREAGHGAPEAGSATAPESPRPLVEMQLFFDDFRKVGAVWLPHHLTRSIKGEPNEEIQFDKFEVK